MENWRDRVSSQSLPTTVAPRPRRSRRRTSDGGEWKGGRIGRLSPLSSSLFPARRRRPTWSLYLALSQSLCLSGRRLRRRRCRGRRGKKKRLNQEPECSQWELSRSSKGPAAAVTLRNKPKILRLEIKEEREAVLPNQRRNRMVARFPPLINAVH